MTDPTPSHTRPVSSSRPRTHASDRRHWNSAKQIENFNARLESLMGRQHHTAYQEAMLHIEQPLQHLAEIVGMHGQVLNSIWRRDGAARFFAAG